MEVHGNLSILERALRNIAADDDKPDTHRLMCALACIGRDEAKVTARSVAELLGWPEERTLTAVFAAQEHGLLEELT